MKKKKEPIPKKKVTKLLELKNKLVRKQRVHIMKYFKQGAK